MERTGLNRNFTLTLLDTLIKGIPDYMSGRIQNGDTDGVSCLNSVLFFWYNIEHHFDGQASCRNFSLFLRNKYDWNVPEGIPKGQIIETDSESRLINLDFDLNRITQIPASDLLRILECLCSLSVTDPYPYDWYTSQRERYFNGPRTIWIPMPPRPEDQCSHVLESNRERPQDFEGLPWDTGKMTATQEQYIKDLRVSLGLDQEEYYFHIPTQSEIDELAKYREIQHESIRALDNLNESRHTLENGVKTEETPEDLEPDFVLWIQIATHLVDKDILKDRTINNRTVYCPNGSKFKKAEIFNKEVIKYAKEKKIPLVFDDNRHTPLSEFTRLGLFYPPNKDRAYKDSKDFERRYLKNK